MLCRDTAILLAFYTTYTKFVYFSICVIHILHLYAVVYVYYTTLLFYMYTILHFYSICILYILHYTTLLYFTLLYKGITGFAFVDLYMTCICHTILIILALILHSQCLHTYISLNRIIYMPLLPGN